MDQEDKAWASKLSGDLGLGDESRMMFDRLLREVAHALDELFVMRRREAQRRVRRLGEEVAALNQLLTLKLASPYLRQRKSMISYVSRGVQTEEEEKRLRDLHRTQDHKEHRALSFALPHMDDIRDSLNRRNEIRERAKSFAVGRKSVAGGFMGVVARAVAAGGSGTEDGTNSPRDAAAGAPGDAGKRPTVRRTLTPGRVGLRPS